MENSARFRESVARHAKILDTDQAWEVFEKLEDHYFAAKVDAGSAPDIPGVGHANPGSLPLNDGRYVVVMRGRSVISFRDISDFSLVNGHDPVNVLTFLREYAAPDVFPVALDIVMRRMCFYARNNKTGKYRDELLLAVARASAALTKDMDKSPDRLMRTSTRKQNQGHLC